MVCLSSYQDGSMGGTILLTLLMGLFRWCITTPPTVGETELVSGTGRRPRPGVTSGPGTLSNPALDTNLGTCETGLWEQWKDKCDTKVIMFTEMKPDDFLAIPAVFRWANEMSVALKCDPRHYPVKGIVSGGGRFSDLWLSQLRRYLRLLQGAGIVPDASRFDIDAQTCAGPVAPDAQIPLYVQRYQYALYRAEEDPVKSTLESTAETMQATMEMLLRQIDAPSSRITIIALRPIWEFAVLWSEYLLNQANPRFNVTDEYREVMRRATSSNSSTWATSPENVRASLLAFKQTRIVMFQGDATEEEHGSFTNIGRFFDTQIQDSRTTTDTPGNVRLLEEAFVNWPVQFLLVDRRSMLSNERPQKQHMFDGTVQPRFFELFRLLESQLRPFLELVIRSWNGPLINKLRDDIDRLMAALGFAYTWIDKWPKKLVVQWAHLEAHRATFIRADDLLLPFVLGSKTNLVRESFRKVRYQGRDRATGRHSWAEAGEFSDSTVWFTNTSSSARDATSNADDREVRLQRELGSLYEKAFQRFVFP